MIESWDDNLWANTVGYGARAPKVSYLSDAQNCRMERMRVARLLWKGNHRQAYLTERRSQFDFPEMEVQGFVWWPYLTFNCLKLISTTMADLLLLEDPSLTTADEDVQTAIDDLKIRSDFDRVCYDAVRGSSWSSEGMVEILRWDGQVYVQDVRPSEVFPIGDRQPDGQYASYNRYATALTTESKPRRVLLISTYLPGSITRKCCLIGDDGKPQGDAGLALWPTKRPDGSDLLPEEGTGIEWNTIVWMANEMDEGKATSDYDGLIELQDSLNAKQTQIARVIAQHADPAVAFPEMAADPDGNIRTRKKMFFYRSKDEIPQYITWNAELSAAIEDRDFALTSLLIAAELPPGLLGLDKGGAPDSARKLRLQAGKGLARAKRKAKFVRPFIRTAAETALMMINAGSRVKIAMPGDGFGLAVDLHDGLPIDDLDQAQTIALLTGGKPTMSVERGVELQIADPEAREKEIGLLKSNQAEATPSVIFSGDQTGGGDEPQTHADGHGANEPETPEAAGIKPSAMGGGGA